MNANDNKENMIYNTNNLSKQFNKNTNEKFKSKQKPFKLLKMSKNISLKKTCGKKMPLPGH